MAPVGGYVGNRNSELASCAGSLVEGSSEWDFSVVLPSMVVKGQQSVGGGSVRNTTACSVGVVVPIVGKRSADDRCLSGCCRKSTDGQQLELHRYQVARVREVARPVERQLQFPATDHGKQGDRWSLQWDDDLQSGGGCSQTPIIDAWRRKRVWQVVTDGMIGPGGSHVFCLLFTMQAIYPTPFFLALLTEKKHKLFLFFLYYFLCCKL